jgi:hypothetical protein
MARAYNSGDVGALSSLVGRIFDTLAGGVTVSQDGAAHLGQLGSVFYLGQLPSYLDNVSATLSVAPTGAPIIIDILLSTDGGVTFSSLWNNHPEARLTVPVGATTASATAFPTGDRIAADTMGKVFVTQIGTTGATGSGLSVQINTGPY